VVLSGREVLERPRSESAVLNRSSIELVLNVRLVNFGLMMNCRRIHQLHSIRLHLYDSLVLLRIRSFVYEFYHEQWPQAALAGKRRAIRQALRGRTGGRQLFPLAISPRQDKAQRSECDRANPAVHVFTPVS
jgi:hypothetical protein